MWHEIAKKPTQFGEQIVLPIVIPKLQFLEIQREEFSGHAMMFDQPFLGEAPESLQPVYIDLTG